MEAKDTARYGDEWIAEGFSAITEDAWSTVCSRTAASRTLAPIRKCRGFVISVTQYFGFAASRYSQVAVFTLHKERGKDKGDSRDPGNQSHFISALSQ